MGAVLNARGDARCYADDDAGGAWTWPDVARAIYEAGPKARPQRAGRLPGSSENGRAHSTLPDPLEAAEFFAGMVHGRLPEPRPVGRRRSIWTRQMDKRIAQEAAARFMRAYAP